MGLDASVVNTHIRYNATLGWFAGDHFGHFSNLRS